MPLISWLKSKENKLPLALLGILVTIVAAFAGMYVSPYLNKADITYEITNESNVLDIHEPIKNLSISFQGNDIQEKNLNLRIITIIVKNNGGVNITPNDYDPNDIWGFQVPNGEIIEVRLLESNDVYIMKNITPRLLTTDTVYFEKIIFDKDRYFKLQILVLHPKDKLPEIIPIGKISGIDEITIIKSWKEQEKQNFIEKFFDGGILINILRIIFYPFIFIILIILILTVPDKLREYQLKKKMELRKRKIDAFLIPEYIHLGTEKIKLLESIYQYNGLNGLTELKTNLQNPIYLDETYKRLNLIKATKDRHPENISELYLTTFDFRFDELIESGIISYKKGGIVVDAIFMTILNSIINHFESEE